MRRVFVVGLMACLFISAKAGADESLLKLNLPQIEQVSCETARANAALELGFIKYDAAKLLKPYFEYKKSELLKLKAVIHADVEAKKQIADLTLEIRYLKVQLRDAQADFRDQGYKERDRWIEQIRDMEWQIRQKQNKIGLIAQSVLTRQDQNQLSAFDRWKRENCQPGGYFSSQLLEPAVKGSVWKDLYQECLAPTTESKMADSKSAYADRSTVEIHVNDIEHTLASSDSFGGLTFCTRATVLTRVDTSRVRVDSCVDLNLESVQTDDKSFEESLNYDLMFKGSNGKVWGTVRNSKTLDDYARVVSEADCTRGLAVSKTDDSGAGTEKQTEPAKDSNSVAPVPPAQPASDVK
jgi:hypothetical protein